MSGTDKIKVVRIITRLNIGGPAIHTILLNEGLNNNGFEERLITGLPSKEEGDMSYLASEKNIKITVIPELGRKLNIWADLRALWKLFRIIKAERPQIVHTHTAKAGTLGMGAAILNGTPVKVHSFHGHVFHDYFSPAATQVFVSVERMLARFTDRILVVSEKIKNDICEKFKVADKSRTEVMKLGLDLDKFREPEKVKGSFRKTLNIKEGVLLIGIVGRLTAIKNHALFLEAVRLIKQEAPDLNAKFLIIGDGELRKSLEDKASELGLGDEVVFTGWQKDMAALYADLDIVALTSLNEGTPVSVIEAMAAGKAVVATAVGGVPDVIEDKKTGLLVPSDDPARLKQAIISLARDKDLRERLGRAAGADVYKKYSKERLIKDMGELYKRLLREKGVLEKEKIA